MSDSRVVGSMGCNEMYYSPTLHFWLINFSFFDYAFLAYL